MRVVRSTDESVVLVLRIRTGAMVALLPVVVWYVVAVVYESEERSAAARGVLFGFMN